LSSRITRLEWRYDDQEGYAATAATTTTVD